MALLSARNIHKRYGQLDVLKGVDFSMERGEIVSIVGPSGSGKSTLLHILSTLDKANQGEVLINGIPVAAAEKELKPAAWWKRLLNLAIDQALIVCIAGGVLSLFDPAPDIDYGIFTVIVAGTGILYYTVLEGLMGRTVGKLLTGTKVFAGDSFEKPRFTDALLRSVARYVPFGLLEALSFLSKNPNGWHDSLPGTIVADAKTPYSPRYKELITGARLAAFRNKHIGFVFQFHHLLPEFTALENVCIPAWLQGQNNRRTTERARELLVLLGLQHRMEHKPGELSGGEQQRVAVARALINKPDIVFADEPTGNLDSANARELHDLFFRLRSELGQTFLIVTHNEDLARLSDRVVSMKDGRVI